MKKSASPKYLHYEKLAQEPVADEATKVDIDFDSNARSPSSKKGGKLLSQDSLAVSVKEAIRPRI